MADDIKPEQKEEIPAGNKGNILLVDDDKFLIDMYAMKFTAAGFQVHACLSVADALKTLKGGFAADAVMFDLVMPEQDGFSFLETLKTEHIAEKAVRIALTNQSDDAEKARAESLGVDRYFVKAGMIPSEVVAAVSAEMEKHGKK